MSNNYGAFAAITVDAAGTEHAVWEHEGLLWHTYFDEAANQWSDAEPVSNATGGSDLQLLAGDLIPYLVQDDKGSSVTAYAPGLAAVWEDNSGNLYYVVGRYTETGQVQWSDAIDFGQPTLNNPNDTVLSTNPQATITSVPEPGVAVVYEISDTATKYVAHWQGISGNDNYRITFRFTGKDTNNDGILSGRGTNNDLGDGITNELSTWEMAILDTDGTTLLATYDLSDQQKLDSFNFNFDIANNLILANADAKVFKPDAIDIPAGQYGLNVGLDRSADATGDLWQLASQSADEKIVLQKTLNGSSTPTDEANSSLASTIFPIASSTPDDTDIYSEFISFTGDARTSDSLKDHNGNTVTFVKETPVSPRYESFGPEAQFLTTDTINSANADSALSVPPASQLATTPLGTTQGFAISFASAQRVIAGNVPLPNSLISTNSNNGIQFGGSIGSARQVGYVNRDGRTQKVDNYLVQTSLSLGLNRFEQNPLNPSSTTAQQALNKTQTGIVAREGIDFSITLGLNTTFTPDSKGDLQYKQADFVLTIGFGRFFQFRISIPGTPKNLANAILQGDFKLSDLNFKVDFDVALKAKSGAEQLPIHLEGNVNDPSKIQLVNTTIDSWLQNSPAPKGFALSQAIFETFTRLNQVTTTDGDGNEKLGPPRDGGVSQNLLLAEEVILGLLYAIQIVEQAAYLLENTDQYTFSDIDIRVEWLPSVSGSIQALFNLLSGSASGSLDLGVDLKIPETGDVTAGLEARESFAASAALVR
jgi:hypothetical protein